MTRDEVKAMLQDLGMKAEEITDEIIEKVTDKIETEKEKLDTETRRTVRKVWIVISVVALFVGIGIGRFF